MLLKDVHSHVLRKIWVVVLSMFILVCTAVRTSTFAADGTQEEPLRIPTVIQQYVQSSTEADKFEEEILERWRKDEEFRASLRSLIIASCKVAFFDEQREDMTAWGASLFLVYMPKSVLVETIAPRLRDGEILEGLFAANEVDELVVKLEGKSAKGQQSFPSPCFGAYEEYLADNWNATSRPLYAHMLKRDLFGATEIAIGITSSIGADVLSDEEILKVSLFSPPRLPVGEESYIGGRVGGA